jgi:choice-of-anchor B domain-containing protein
MTRYYRDFLGPVTFLMVIRLLAVMTAALSPGLSPPALADSDEPPLFVATNGVDAGSCQDSIAPCRSIDYALRRVGKNGQIRIATGDYALDSPENVFYLVSGAIDVRADPGATLVGIPHEFARDLEMRGFRVIADSKGLSRETEQKLVSAFESLSTSSSATACVGGFADVFPCEKVDLLAHVAGRTTGARGADIWGFVDLNSNREYAIMGYSTGTAVYDVTDARNPREVGFVDGQTTTWRDIKVYQFWNAADARWNAYAYVTADNASDGLFVIDLTQLPHSISRVNSPSDFREAHNVYITKTDFSTGLALTDDDPVLVIAGSNLSDGRFRAYSVEDPASPSFIAIPATPAGQPGTDRLYMHDAASMLVTDERKDTQCVNAGASPYCDVLFDFNESSLDIWDVTDPGDPMRLSRTPYSNFGYSHSGWWSEDKQYVFLQDELDERDRGLLTTLRAFSISDLTSPVLAGTWTGPTRAIDHNGFVRGNRYYMSNYARGLTILDISDPANPIQVGRFDSFPASDSVGFPGAWGAYPFLPSGHILISDIDSGFYIVDDRTRSVEEGSLAFSAAAFGAEETESAVITVQRLGGATGPVTVNWEIIAAHGSTADVVATKGTLSWADGDASDKIIDLGIQNDGVPEDIERLVIKLTAPQGGATLASPNLASLYISDPGGISTVEFDREEVTISERGFATAVAVMRRKGSVSGTLAVQYAISDGNATAGTDYSGPANGTITWADGDAGPKWIEYGILDDGSGEDSEFFELTLSDATGGSIGGSSVLRINISDGTGVNATPNAVAGNNQTVSSGSPVTLDGGSSNDPDGDPLTYAWMQTLGPAVVLSGANTSSASFSAPSVSSDTLLRFSLAVSDPGGLSDSATVAVTVRSSESTSGGGGGVFSLWLLALLLFERMRLDYRLLAIRSR